ncbi:hypothetical protein MRB53_032759 [Persea americana]|uniref:Uncharacterized protein n=1 Tax=Persea americana TaxID=3435 RepID=A0ACC2KSR8_PERAE|nr:hypothetical protein MRB53_032759 [Persea americana]
MIMTSLEELEIIKCGNLESLCSEGLQNLTSLYIDECPKVWSSPVWLRNLTSLKKLDVVVLDESLGNLASLTDLRIRDCPAVTELPKGLQRLTNLRRLSIRECAVLERQLCKNWKEWKKVAHVPGIFIDNRSLSWEAEDPSLMQSLKKGCNKFDKKLKLHFPTCASSSSPSPSNRVRPIE